MELHYVFEVRMVESETIALRNFMVDYVTIVADLKSTLQAADAASGAKEVIHIKMRTWLRKLTQFKFVAVCLVLIDINTASRRFSKAAQSEDGIATDHVRLLADYRDRISTLRNGSYGSQVQSNIEQLRRGFYGNVQLVGVPGAPGVSEVDGVVEIGHGSGDDHRRVTRGTAPSTAGAVNEEAVGGASASNAAADADKVEAARRAAAAMMTDAQATRGETP